MGYFDKRNWKIYFEWIDGKQYKELAEEFDLAHSTIKEICHSLLPPTVRGNIYQSQNAYKRYREWKRTHKAPLTERSPELEATEKPLYRMAKYMTADTSRRNMN